MEFLTLWFLSLSVVLTSTFPQGSSDYPTNNDAETVDTGSNGDPTCGSAKLVAQRSFLNPMESDGFMKKIKGCLIDVKAGPTFIDSLKFCAKSFDALRAMISSGSFPSRLEIRTYMTNFSVCIFGQFNLTDSSANLNFTRLRELAKLTNFTGDATKISAMSAVLSSCIDDVQHQQGNASVLMRKFTRCKDKGFANYCRSIGQPSGAWEYIGAMMTLGEDSPCKNVMVPSSVEQNFTDCINQVANPSTGTTTEVDAPLVFGSRGPNRSGPQTGSPTETTGKGEEMAIALCVFTKAGFINGTGRDTKFNASSMIAFVKNFNGWSEIPQLNATVFTALNNCSSLVDPHKNYKNQLKFFAKCIMLPFADTCGLNNNVAKFLFPAFRDDMMKRIITKLVNRASATGAHGDFSDLMGSDEDDSH